MDCCRSYWTIAIIVEYVVWIVKVVVISGGPTLSQVSVVAIIVLGWLAWSQMKPDLLPVWVVTVERGSVEASIQKWTKRPQPLRV